MLQCAKLQTSSKVYILTAILPTAAGTVVTCLSSIASQFGKHTFYPLGLINYYVVIAGEGDEKGKVMGIFRSLGALARAVGPITACTGNGKYPSSV